MDKAGDFNPALMVHGTEGIELFDEIPAEGEIESVGEITGVWDKGKAGVLEFESTATLVATGKPLFKVKMSLFCRGAGDFGGERGPSSTFEIPDRKADHEVTYVTREDQALTYRLSGDRNPLHSDPSFAAIGGFDRPILHGLCTYGFTGRALLHSLCDGDPSRFKGMDGRFSKPVDAGRCADGVDVGRWRGSALPDQEPEWRGRSGSGCLQVLLVASWNVRSPREASSSRGLSRFWSRSRLGCGVDATVCWGLSRDCSLSTTPVRPMTAGVVRRRIV